MTEFNNNPMNTDQRSKVSLVLFIVSILILVMAGGYLVYAQSLVRTSETNNLAKTNNTDNTVANNNTNTINNTPTATNSQIPAGWKSYTLTSCGIKVHLPKNWSFDEGTTSEDNYSMISNSPERVSEINKEGYPSLAINCYNSIKDFINSSNNAKSITTAQVSLEEALNIKNPHSDVFYNIFDFTSKPQTITLNNINGFQGLQGGFGVTLNRYFENNGKIIEIKTDDFDQTTLELYTTDQQIQNFIEFHN